MLHEIKRSASRTARRFALGGVGLGLTTVGAGFLTVSAWVALGTVLETQMVALIIGGAYLGLGLICLGLASAGRSGRAHHGASTVPPRQPLPVEGMIAAFTEGMRMGRAARR